MPICKECDSKVGHTNFCTAIINELGAAKYFTEYQLKFLVKVLKKYRDLKDREFHFSNESRTEAAKELLLIKDLIEYLK